MTTDFAIVTPLANESASFTEFAQSVARELDQIGSGTAYLVVDNASTDNTRQMCEEQSNRDPRFKTIWAPNNRNVVDAYLAGYRAALANEHAFIIEMDAGLSHDPKTIPMFLQALQEGNQCAFGSRFTRGGSIGRSTRYRTFLSKGGTHLSNWLLGMRYSDATSGFLGFDAQTAGQLCDFGLKSKAHFYQTEIRYLLRNARHVEVPIHYQAPSPRVTGKAIRNSISVLLQYFVMRLTGNAAGIDK